MKTTSEDILNGPIGPTLRRMTTPMVIGILAVILFQAVDTWFIGRLGTTELAAISFTFPVTYTITNLAIGLSISTSILLAQVIGSGQRDKAQRIATDSLLLSLLLVVILAAVGLVTIDPLFRWLGATDNTLPYIREYMEVWYASVGLLVIPIIGNGAIRATGDTKWPSILMMISGLANAVLDPLLIFGIGPFPELGVRGAAIATALSWLFSFVAATWLLRVREKLLLFHLPGWRELATFWRALLKIGIPIAIANMLTPIATAILTALIAPFGETAVAAFGAGSRIEAVAMVVSFALTAALSPYMAQNLGAGQCDRARQALQLCLRFALLFQLAIYALLALTSPWLSQVFSSDPQVIALTRLFLWIMPLGFSFYGVLIVTSTAFNAAKQSHKTLIVSLIRVFACIAPCAWLGGQIYGISGLFVGTVIGNGIAALVGWRMLHATYDHLTAQEAQASQQVSVPELELES